MQLSDLWALFSRGLGRALVPHLGRQGARKAINRTVSPACFGTSWARPCTWPEPSATARRARRAAGTARSPSEGLQRPAEQEVRPGLAPQTLAVHV